MNQILKDVLTSVRTMSIMDSSGDTSFGWDVIVRTTNWSPRLVERLAA